MRPTVAQDVFDLEVASALHDFSQEVASLRAAIIAAL
jgi:hypothetical protein